MISVMGPSCPSCGRKGIAAGHDFRAPKKSDKKRWKVVIKMLQRGIKFHAGYDSYYDYRFKTINEFKYFLIRTKLLLFFKTLERYQKKMIKK